MREFAHSILNYFAAYNETRFKFGKRLPYEWGDDATTLDLSVFPEFEEQLLAAIAAGQAFSLTVPQGRHVVNLDPEIVRAELTELISATFNDDFLAAQVDEARDRLLASLPEDERDGIQQRAAREGMRQYNLALRQAVRQALIDLQSRRIEDLRSRLDFRDVPPSTFNPMREDQRIYDDLTKKTTSRSDVAGYVDEVRDYLAHQPFAYTIFDLHLCLRQFLEFVGLQGVHVFFHEIAGQQGPRYPLFTVEVTGTDDADGCRISSVRDILMLNTPAINNYEFDTVLTTPRACRFDESATHIAVIERFLQAKYSVGEPFVLRPRFQSLVGDAMPAVRYRIGLQAVKDEDRRILDYSELMTTLDEGAGRKFSDLLARYVGSNVENTAAEVDRTYRDRYPRASGESLVPKSLGVPLRLNEAQRRILTAAENPRNEIMVVDGPPGTGKSYTIAALVYLANQLGRSVVVTSHKRQALDVIEQTLTEQFKELHPQAKPSILRLEKSTASGGINTLRNTLSTQAVNAARRRAEDLHGDAVESDRERIRQAITGEYHDFWQQADGCEQRLRLVRDWTMELEALLDGIPQPHPTPRRFPPDNPPKPDSLRRLMAAMTSNMPTLSLQSLVALSDARERIPGMLRKCDELSRLGRDVPDELPDRVPDVPSQAAGFRRILDRITRWTEPGAMLANCRPDALEPEKPVDMLGALRLTYDDAKAACILVDRLASIQAKMFGGILRRKEIASATNCMEADYPEIAAVVKEHGAVPVRDALQIRIDAVDALKRECPFVSPDYLISGHVEYTPDALRDDLDMLTSLEYAPVAERIAQLTSQPLADTPFPALVAASDQLLDLAGYLSLRSEVATFAGHVGMDMSDLPRLYATLRNVGAALESVHDEDMASLTVLFDAGREFLAALGIESHDVSSLFRFCADSRRMDHLLRFIELHGRLSAFDEPKPPDAARVATFFDKTHRLLQRDVDDRFAGLLNYMGDVARMQTAIDSGKRITVEQARVLLDGLSCLIAEPALISQHFPMEPGMIDFLIIDEASQVSIAESISLMLRARQTIVFGDELQYGAVGALNVSQRYSEHYFKDILTAYAKTQTTAIPDAERDRLAREASENPDEETEESSSIIPVAPGTREWLKTFSVRTSTLAFAKALQNYSASLNTHFRSFPEIISYSNDVFYRPSQIELVTNRIRTKPIGDVLRFLPVTTRGMSGRNVNLDEIEAIQRDIERMTADDYTGTIGVICSFKEQTARMDEIVRKKMAIYPDLVRKHKFAIWFVGDVQGEERDLVYYSFVQDKTYDNADLKTIYPALGGSADNIRRLKMQRLNVGFSRARDMMVFVHSMEIGDYSDTRLGDALRHYEKILAATHDHYIEDETVFESPAEKRLYTLIVQTPYFQANRDSLRLVAQFEIGQYIRQEFRRYIPAYRVDFLLTRTDGGKEKSLIIEYDGLEFHTKNPDIVTADNFDREYLEYDIERQIELESYGYSFLRINKFTLTPTAECKTPVAVLDHLLRTKMRDV